MCEDEELRNELELLRSRKNDLVDQLDTLSSELESLQDEYDYVLDRIVEIGEELNGSLGSGEVHF